MNVVLTNEVISRIDAERKNRSRSSVLRMLVEAAYGGGIYDLIINEQVNRMVKIVKRNQRGKGLVFSATLNKSVVAAEYVRLNSGGYVSAINQRLGAAGYDMKITANDFIVRVLNTLKQ